MEDQTDEKMMMGDSGEKKDDSKDELEYPPPPLTPAEVKILNKIARKKYEEGDTGKMEALADIQSVFDELHQEQVIQERVNIFARPEEEQGVGGPSQNQDSAASSSKYGRKRLNVSSLTPLISMNLDKFKVSKATKEFASEQNLVSGRGQKNRLVTPSMPELIHYEGAQIDDEEDMKSDPQTLAIVPPESDLEMDAFRRVKSDLEMSSFCEEEEEEDGTDSETEGSGDPQRKAKESFWKDDLTRLAKITSTSKVNISYLVHDRETFQLKYTPPIWPHQLGLWQILADMPAITCLILDGSELECLRDLGSYLPSLVTLSVARCGLTSLDGTGALPYLRTLIASNNQLPHVIQVTYLTELCHLDVSSNPIKSLDTFAHLIACPKLRSLKMYGTPISRSRDFYVKMKSYLPKLKELYPMSGASDWTLSKGKSSKRSSKEESRVKSIMAHEFEIIYKNNFQKKPPLPQGMDASGDTGDEAGSPNIFSDGGTTSEMEMEDKYEHPFIQTIRKLGNVSKDSFITEIDENEMSEVTGEGDSDDWFYSAENSETEAFEDASGI